MSYNFPVFPRVIILWLAFSTQYNDSKIHPCCCIWQWSPHFLLCNVPSCNITVILLLCNVPSWKAYSLLCISCWWTFGLLMGFCGCEQCHHLLSYTRFLLHRGKNVSGVELLWIMKFNIFHSSVQFSRSVMSDSLRPRGLLLATLPCVSPTPGPYSNSCPLSWWCHPTISSSVVPFSSYPQSLPASGSFPVSQLFEWGGQSIGVSASASVLPVNIQDWFSLGWMGWISLQSKGLSRVFSNTTVQKHPFFGTQLSL